MAFKTEIMVTLVLGSGHWYPENGGDRCCPISWKEYDAIQGKVLVDRRREYRPDVLFDMQGRWPFATESVDRVIDTTGLGTRTFGRRFWKELHRVMRPGASMTSQKRKGGELERRAARHGFVFDNDGTALVITRLRGSAGPDKTP